MRLREIFTEAWRNVRAGTSGALMFALAAGLLGGLAGGIDVTTSVAGIRTAYEFRAAGANVQMITLNGLIDGPGCDSLPGADGTVAAGAFRILDDRIRVAALPGSALTQVEVTPGLVEVLTGERSDSGAGLWASQTLAEDLGLDVGDEVRTDRGTTTLAGTFAFPSDGRDRALGYALLSPVLASSGIFDTCLVETWPPRLRGDGWTAPAVLPGPDQHPEFGLLNASLGTELDLQILIETSVWACAGALMAVPVLAWFAIDWNSASVVEPWISGVRVLLAGAAAAPLGALFAMVVTLESHLFRYFKQR